MSIVKNINKYPNNNLTDILSLMFHSNTKPGNSPFNISNKNSLRNTLERINCKNKKNNSTRKSKNKSKDSEILINNYLSQRPRLNTEGNDNNLMKMKFSMDFFKNKIDKMFQENTKKISTNKKINENDNNFRKAKINNKEMINKSKKLENSNILNKKKNNNFHFTRITSNNQNSYNKKIIENTNNEYNMNTQNFSHTQSYFNQTNKSKNRVNNNQKFLNSENIKHKNKNKSEDIKRQSALNNKIVKEKKMKNFSGLIQQISPFHMTNNKLSHIQNYFKNINENKKIINNQKEQQKKIEKILATEPKLNNSNRLDTGDFILKDNSNYLFVSKNPTQITNIIEKKENNKYINNYFNICDSTNINNKNKDNLKSEDKSDYEENNYYDTYEEIHFYFIQKIQKGKKLKLNIINKKS